LPIADAVMASELLQLLYPQLEAQMADQKSDRDVQSPQGSEKLSHHDKKLKRKEMMEKMKGGAQERPASGQSSTAGKKLPLPD
jgi:hypothetical protein